MEVLEEPYVPGKCGKKECLVFPLFNLESNVVET